MAYNPLSTKSLQDLGAAIDRSADQLKPFRKHAFDTMQMYVGKYYGDNDKRGMKQTPLNLLQLAVDIYVQSIAPVCPKFLARPVVAGLKRPASMLDLALNHVANELNLRDEFQECVMNAMFSIGIMKVGTAAIDDGTLIDATQPYAKCVSLDDWVHDTTARRYTECSFASNKYRMDYEMFKESGLYKNTEKVSFYDDLDVEQHAIKRIGGHDNLSQCYRRSVELRDVWLPADGLVVTIPANDSAVNLRTVEWGGVEIGPYHLLTFAPVSDNVMPVAPVSAIRDLSELANDLMIKLANQSRRQKDVTAYSATGAEDAKRVKDANDGDMIGVTDPSQIAQLNFGGANPQTQAMLLQLRDWNSYMAGNLDLLGGLSAQSQTLGQDQLLGASASKRMEILRQRYESFAQSVGKAVANELWYDPMIDLPLVKRTSNVGLEIPVRFNEESKEGDFLDYNINIDPYSTTHMSPPERLQMLTTLLQQAILPAMPFLQQQGGTLNMVEYLDILSRYADAPELKNMIQFQDAQANNQQDPINPQPSSTSNVTSREYIRRNVPTGGTQQNRDNLMAQALLGQDDQPKQQASIMRI